MRALFTRRVSQEGERIGSGLDRYRKTLVGALAGKVDFIFADDPTLPNEFVSNSGGNWPTRIDDETRGGTTSGRARGSGFRLFAGYVRDSLRLAAHWRRFRGEVDLIHVNHVGCEVQTLAARIAGFRKIVGTVHNLPGEDDAAQHRVRRFVERLSFGAGHFYIVVSDATYKAWDKRVGLSKRKVVRIYNGMEPPDLHGFDRDAYRGQFCARTDRAVLIGICARLHPMKGHVVLLEAVAKLLRSAMSAGTVILLIAGDGPERANLEAKVRDLKIKEHVRFLGHRDDAIEFAAGLDVNVLPSVFSETLGYSVVEAMFTGVPSVVSDIGGAKELIRASGGGRVVRAGDVEALCEALRFYMENPAVRLSDGAAGLDFAAKNLTAKQMADATLRAYEELFDPWHRKGLKDI